MPRGGKRPGAGRQNGSKNKRTKAVEAAVQAAHEMISHVLPNAFDGDAHTLLIATYRDLTVPLETRIDCAKAAIGYEKPRLAAVDHTSDGEKLETRIEMVVVDPSPRSPQIPAAANTRPI